MLISHGLDSQFVLELLNGDHASADFSARIRYIAALPSGMDILRKWAERSPERWPHDLEEDFPDDLPANDAVFRHGIQFLVDYEIRKAVIQEHSAEWSAVAALLRRYIDQWIKSGYDEAGIETPQRRFLPDDLQRKLKSCCEENPLQVRVQKWGEVVADWPSAPSHGDFANYEALRLMLDVLGSQFKYTIAKCSKHTCVSYFERTKLQGSFKRGAYCPKHSRGAGTDKVRKDEKGDLLKVAMKFYSRWTPTKHPNRALWVSRKMNETRRGTQRRITQKWVSRNRVAIEEEVHNAKG